MSPFSLRLASFNIRYDNPGDRVHSWPHRREWVRDLLEYHDFDAVGIQEALAHQLDYLTQGRLAAVGVGRDDGRAEGEFAPILYDPRRLEVLESGTFWLSETPEVPSVGWDAALPRICTWAQMRPRAQSLPVSRALAASRGEFLLLNTHFDHRGALAREHSARLLASRIGAATLPAVLTGDFNSTPDSSAIRHLAATLHDCRTASETPLYGPAGTFHGFAPGNLAPEPIDYIFVTPEWRVLRVAHLTDSPAGYPPSDHLPVAVILFFKPLP